MYVDEDYNPQGDGGGLSFSVKINAYGKVKEAPAGSKMKAYMTQADLDNENFSPQTDFHTDAYKSKITSIITKKDNIVPATATESWDISEAQDGSVMAYVEDDGTGNSTYKVTIGGKGGIIANESMMGYFAGFSKMTSIDLSALDTSEVTNMNNMFSGCGSLLSLDVSKFDTSKVTDMGSMFSGCNSLTSLEVNKFDTSKVTAMYFMFSGCRSLPSLDVRNFDTSEVTNMDGMFDSCSSLTNLDVSNFDTSQVTTMNGMFCNCPAWNTVDQTKFAYANECAR
jgi:surface protein